MKTEYKILYRDSKRQDTLSPERMDKMFDHWLKWSIFRAIDETGEFINDLYHITLVKK